MPRRDDTFLLYYWEDYQQFVTDNPSCYYCLSESTIQLCLSALRFAGWPTRWRVDRDDNSRRVTDLEIWDKIDALSALAQQELINDMSCDLQAGFETLATAIENASNKDALTLLAQNIGRLAGGQCCDGQSNLTTSGGIVGSYTDGNGYTQPIYGSGDLYELPESGFPPEFDSLEDYLANKCQMANLVFDGWLLTMRGLGALTTFNAVALAGLIVASAGPFIIFPPAALAVALGALFVAASFVVMFYDICDTLQANKSQIVCELYLSDTVEEMTAILGEAIDDAVELLSVAAPISAALKTVAILIVNGDTLNQILQGVAGASYPDADCSGCEGCHTVAPNPPGGVRGSMTLVSETDTSYEAVAAPYSDRDRWDFGLAINGTAFNECCGAMVTVTSVTVTAGAIGSSGDATPAYRFYDCDGAILWSDATGWPELPYDAAYVEVVSGTEFTLEVEWTWND